MIEIKTKDETLEQLDLKSFIKKLGTKSITLNGNKFSIIEVNEDSIIVEKHKRQKGLW